MIPLNVEAVLTEDWTFEYVHSYRNSSDILDLTGAYIKRDARGNIEYHATALITIPEGTKFLIRKYDLNQGSINGLVTVTLRFLGRSPKVKLAISEMNKVKYELV